MVEGKLRQIANEIITERGPLNLFMLAKFEEGIDKWSLAVSAPWITEDSNTELFNYLVSKLKDKLDEEELRSISRVGIFKSNHPIVGIVTGAFNVRDSSLHLVDTRIDGLTVKDAYLFESNRPATED